MTRKDYEMVARDIRTSIEDGLISQSSATKLASRMADTFERHHREFRRWQFLTACGVAQTLESAMAGVKRSAASEAWSARHTPRKG